MQLLLAVLLLLLGQAVGDAQRPSSHEPIIAINAGGARTTTAEGLIYEADRSEARELDSVDHPRMLE